MTKVFEKTLQTLARDCNAPLGLSRGVLTTKTTLQTLYLYSETLATNLKVM